jgi:pimeloyl-ACP methyl ester carboxylesterase
MMEEVMSRDGTRITYYRGGSGPPLVLVHGTSGVYTRWAPVFPGLEEHVTVYALDRRGRGESGDNPVYAIEREFEDLVAVVDAIGEPVHLLGHSFGGILALEAALLTANLRSLILYEGFPLPAAAVPEGLIDRLQALLDSGDRDRLLITFYRDLLHVPMAEVERFRALPEWSARLASAHTLPREMRAATAYTFDGARFQDFRVPTLLLRGGASPDFVQTVSAAMEEALPHSQIGVLPGQGHLAYQTAPDLFVNAVLAFLSAVDGRVAPDSASSP